MKCSFLNSTRVNEGLLTLQRECVRLRKTNHNLENEALNEHRLTFAVGTMQTHNKEIRYFACSLLWCGADSRTVSGKVQRVAGVEHCFPGAELPRSCSTACEGLYRRQLCFKWSKLDLFWSESGQNLSRKFTPNYTWTTNVPPACGCLRVSVACCCRPRSALHDDVDVVFWKMSETERQIKAAMFD